MISSLKPFSECIYIPNSTISASHYSHILFLAKLFSFGVSTKPFFLCLFVSVICLFIAVFHPLRLVVHMRIDINMQSVVNVVCEYTAVPIPHFYHSSYLTFSYWIRLSYAISQRRHDCDFPFHIHTNNAICVLANIYLYQHYMHNTMDGNACQTMSPKHSNDKYMKECWAQSTSWPTAIIALDSRNERHVSQHFVVVDFVFVSHFIIVFEWNVLLFVSFVVVYTFGTRWHWHEQ